MTVKFGFYDSLNGDRLYNANDFNTIFEGVFSDGVFEHVGDALMVEANPGVMGVLVKTGRAWFNNSWIRNTSILSVLLTPSSLIHDRIDLIVLEFDSGITIRENSIKVLTGIPAAIPIPPVLANTSTLHQYALAEVLIPATSYEVLLTNITNKIGSGGTPYSMSLISEPSSGPVTTSVNDFQVGDGFGNWITKTLAETITILSTSLNSIYAAVYHNHSASDIISGTLSDSRLPLPTTTTLGGVARNTGATGEYVTGIDSSGNLEYDTPAGGGSGSGYTYSAISVTTANVTAVEGTYYLANVSGLTANRDFILPTPTAVGKQIAIQLTAGDDTYALLLKINGIEWSRIFITKEYVKFVSTGTGASDWTIDDDGRIPCEAILERRSSQSVASGAYPVVVQLTTEAQDVGDIANPSTYKITCRRSGVYDVLGVVIFTSSFSTSKNVQALIHKNGGLLTYQITFIAHTVATQPGMARCPTKVALVQGDYLELIAFQNQGTAVNTDTATGYPHLSVKESLKR